jgi:hypothetical protein
LEKAILFSFLSFFCLYDAILFYKKLVFFAFVSPMPRLFTSTRFCSILKQIVGMTMNGEFTGKKRWILPTSFMVTIHLGRATACQTVYTAGSHNFHKPSVHPQPETGCGFSFAGNCSFWIYRGYLRFTFAA